MKYLLILLYFPLGMFAKSGVFGIVTVVYLFISKPNYLLKLGLIIYYAVLILFFSLFFNVEVNYISFLLLFMMPILPYSRKIISAKQDITMVLFALVMSLYLVFFNNKINVLFGFYFDRNVFGLIVLPFLLYTSKKYKYGFILAILLSIFIGSRNVSLAILLEKVLSKLTIFKIIYIRVPIIVSFISTILPVIILYSLAYYQNSFTFIDSRNYFSILDSSNLDRANALYNAVCFLYENPFCLLFGGGWEQYSHLVTTRVHNDFIQSIIKYGILTFAPFWYCLLKAYNESNIDGSIVISLIIFSSILGGFMWGVGMYWLFIIIFLFGYNKTRKIASCVMDRCHPQKSKRTGRMTS